MVCVRCASCSEELETRLCGSRDIDIDLLRRHTEYSGGVDENSPHIKFMWKVLEDFTQEQRRRFVEFAYAQERLPSSDAGFDAYPKIRMLIKPSRRSKHMFLTLHRMHTSHQKAALTP